MKKVLTALALTFSVALFALLTSGCLKSTSHIKYSQGTFPDTVINIEGINSSFDDYNMALYEITGYMPLVFSSNRGSSGGQFDLVQALVTMTFNQETGDFHMQGNMTEDNFLSRLISKANTPGNDFGPYRFFSSVDGFEYMVLASLNADDNYDFYYTKNQPQQPGFIPEVTGPAPVTLLNSSHNEMYFCLNTNQDSAYFSSDASGNYDIYVLEKPAEINMDAWFSGGHQNANPLNIVNSAADDRCPFIYKNIMVFASDREGGFGGTDLYYSILANGSWSEPVNFGSRINTQYNEFRPVIGGSPNYTNVFMLFSSDRPGGKGGFDLYFSGIDLP